MKKQKQTIWLKKLVLGLMIGVIMTANLAILNAGNLAHAASDVVPKDSTTGQCPTGTYPLVEYEGNQCSATATKCSNSELYYLSNADACKTADTGTTEESAISKKSLEGISAFILAVEKAIQKLIWPILFITGDLINNNLIFGSGMEERLRDIWVPIRNIINIIFVVALVGIALYNVLGISSENSTYSIKSILPKLIAAIIAVNFSFVGVKVLLDGVNVVTTAVFAIPDKVPATMSKVVLSNDSKDSEMRQKFCKQLYATNSDTGDMQDGIDKAAFTIVATKYKINTKVLKNFDEALTFIQQHQEDIKDKFQEDYETTKTNKIFCKVGEGNTAALTTTAETFLSRYGSNNAALAMAINMSGILFYDRAYTLSGFSSNQYESFAISTIFSLLLYIIYATAFIALFVVLLTRIVVLWLALAFSPLIAVALIVPQVKDKSGELIKQFMTHALAPVKIAAVMMVGWVMVDALRNVAQGTTSLDLTTGYAIPGIPVPGMDTIQGILVSLATVAVIWVGVWSAVNGTLAEKLLGAVKTGMEKGGSWLAKAPFKYTPWIPVEIKKPGANKGTLERYSVDQVGGAYNALMNKLEGKKSDLARDLGFLGKEEKTMNDLNSFTKDPTVLGEVGVKYINDIGKGGDIDKKIIHANTEMKDLMYNLEKLSEKPETSQEVRDLYHAIKDGSLDADNDDKIDPGKTHMVKRGVEALNKLKKGAAGSEGAASEADNTLKAGFQGSFGNDADKAVKVYNDISVDSKTQAADLIKDVDDKLKKEGIATPTADQKKNIIDQKISAVIASEADAGKRSKLQKLQQDVDAGLTQAPPTAQAQPAQQPATPAPATAVQAQPAAQPEPKK